MNEIMYFETLYEENNSSIISSFSHFSEMNLVKTFNFTSLFGPTIVAVRQRTLFKHITNVYLLIEGHPTKLFLHITV
jgi:hypothetical protein